ncbi:RICIN domain-containing protein [Saccharothrix australiensis]|uniref:RICIN domain-containing protein n=1 Tax=Saccharothrix australiensis TaxID=2072 RepID=UPI0014777FC3|nr:RICIN domain-containing protein [Saccharothrix australiensis]
MTGASAVLALLVAPAGASADPQDVSVATDQGRALAVNGTYPLRNDNSGKCLDVYEWSTANGGDLVQWDCHYGNNQLWTFIRHDDGSYSLKSAHSGKCADVYNWSTANGGKIVQWDCHGGNNQRWAQSWNNDTNSLRYISKHSGKALEVYDWSQQNGGKIVQWDYHGGANQRWR